MVSRYPVLQARLVALVVPGGLRGSAQGVIRVVQSDAGGRAIIARDAQWRGAVLHTVPGGAGVGQRSRTAHLSRRLPVDVGEAFGQSGAAMGQKPYAAGSWARCPKF